jgi:hypothetical protein
MGLMGLIRWEWWSLGGLVVTFIEYCGLGFDPLLN